MDRLLRTGTDREISCQQLDTSVLLINYFWGKRGGGQMSIDCTGPV